MREAKFISLMIGSSNLLVHLPRVMQLCALYIVGIGLLEGGEVDRLYISK